VRRRGNEKRQAREACLASYTTFGFLLILIGRWRRWAGRANGTAGNAEPGMLRRELFELGFLIVG
jgi:hypothetical protein